VREKKKQSSYSKYGSAHWAWEEEAVEGIWVKSCRWIGSLFATKLGTKFGDSRLRDFGVGMDGSNLSSPHGLSIVVLKTLSRYRVIVRSFINY